MSERRRNALIEAWRIAERELAIRVTTPFRLAAINCVAFLPDFGGPTGMVIDAIEPPDFQPQDGVAKAAEDGGLYLSLVNAESYSCFDAEQFKEALRDWGYCGPVSLRPGWMDS